MRDYLWMAIIYAGAAFLILAGFQLFKSHNRVNIEVGDHTMMPVYKQGGYWVSQLPKYAQLKTGTVVVYSPPGKGAKVEFRRLAYVVAKAGQKVEVADKVLYVDGAKESSLMTKMDLASINIPEVIVPDGCVFLLTNRPKRAEDSYKFGPIPYYTLWGTMKK